MTLVIVLAVLLLGVAVLVLAPVRASIDFSSDGESRRVRWQVRWLLLVFGSDTPGRGRRRPKRPERPKRPKREPGAVGRRVRAALRTPGLPPRCGRLLRQLVAALWPREVEANLRVGLDDPATTGVLFGSVSALVALTPVDWRVHVEPDFAGPVCHGHARAAWSVPPAAVLWPVVTFLAAPVVWRAAYGAWRGRPSRPAVVARTL